MARRKSRGRNRNRDRSAESAALAAAAEDKEEKAVEVEPPEWEVNMETREFTFSSGVRVEFLRLSKNGLEAMQYSDEAPTPPEIPLKRLALPNGNAQWISDRTNKDYQEAKRNYNIRYAHYVQEAAARMSRFAFVEGVVEGPDEAWKARRGRYIKPPKLPIKPVLDLPTEPLLPRNLSDENRDIALDRHDELVAESRTQFDIDTANYALALEAHADAVMDWEDEMKFLWVSDQMFQSMEPKALTEAIVGQTKATSDGVAEAERRFPSDSGREADQPDAEYDGDGADDDSPAVDGGGGSPQGDGADPDGVGRPAGQPSMGRPEGQ